MIFGYYKNNSGLCNTLQPSARAVHRRCGCVPPPSLFLLWSEEINLAVVVQAFNPSTWEAEVGGALSWRPAWSTEQVPWQPALHRETLSHKKTQKENILNMWTRIAIEGTRAQSTGMQSSGGTYAAEGTGKQPHRKSSPGGWRNISQKTMLCRTKERWDSTRTPGLSWAGCWSTWAG